MTLPPDAKFCSRCAAQLEIAQLGDHARPRCPACGLVVYLDPKLVAAAVVGRDGKVLLIQRNLEPGMGRWSLPAGHVNRGEVVEEAVCRETLEETGLRVRPKGLVGLYSEPENIVALAAYSVEVFGGTLKPDAVEVRDVRFFALDALPELAFPRDRTVIRDWLLLQGRSPAG